MPRREKATTLEPLTPAFADAHRIALGEGPARSNDNEQNQNPHKRPPPTQTHSNEIRSFAPTADTDTDTVPNVGHTLHLTGDIMKTSDIELNKYAAIISSPSFFLLVPPATPKKKTRCVSATGFPGDSWYGKKEKKVQKEKIKGERTAVNSEDKVDKTSTSTHGSNRSRPLPSSSQRLRYQSQFRSSLPSPACAQAQTLVFCYHHL